MCIRFQKSLFICTCTKFYKFMHDIVSYTTSCYNIVKSTMSCMELAEVHMNLPNSANSMYDVVKWYFDHFTQP